jgi:hypothetical protein
MAPSPLDAAGRARATQACPARLPAGIITAITVLLDLSLAFFRFCGFEAPGKWAL